MGRAETIAAVAAKEPIELAGKYAQTHLHCNLALRGSFRADQPGYGAGDAH